MKSLTCVVVGDGSVFGVDIDERKKVWHLKTMIKEVKRSVIKCDADQLTLYVAKKGDNWLKTNDPDVTMLENGEVPTGINDIMKKMENKMHPSYRVRNTAFGFPDDDEDAADDGEIHVLVKLPEAEAINSVDEHTRKKARLLTADEHTKVNAIATALQIEQWQVGGLALGIRAIEPDFPEWFYVRKETLDIINIFRRQIEKDRSVVFVGTPGVGKSMLVVLFAFHMALCQQKRIVLLRKVKRKGFTLLYLDPERQQYWRKEKASIADLNRLEHHDFELCLDGFLYDDIESNFGLLASFRLLATNAQYKMKDDDIEGLQQCIVPFWSKADLSTIGMHQQWTESDINNRFYFSGGNLRDFLVGKDAAVKSINQAIAATTAHVAELVSTQYGRASVQQVDRLRMTTIPAPTLVENQKTYLRKYVDCGEWVCGITSQYALRQLGNVVEPSYYEKLWSNGRKIGDDALKGIAFENYVHSMARDGKKIELQVRPYDRKKQKQHTYVAVEFKANSYRNEGRGAVECEAMMQQLVGIDYWYPIDRCLVTIDSVAKLNWDAEHDVAGLIQITKSDTHKIDSVALASYASLLPGRARYVALVPDKETCDRFRLIPADPPTQVPLDVAYIATWNL